MCARTPACARVCARVCMCIHLCVCGVFLDGRAFVMPHVACHVSCHAASHVRDVQIANQPPCLMCRVISSTSTYKAERGQERIQRLSVCLSTCINMHLHVIQSAHQPHILASRPPTSHITPPTSHITPATSCHTCEISLAPDLHIAPATSGQYGKIVYACEGNRRRACRAHSRILYLSHSVCAWT